MNLGPNPWLGPPDKLGQLRTACGCYSAKDKKMIARPNNQEKIQAILDARQPVAEFLQAIGKIEAFNDFSKDDICGLIRAAHDGVQSSLREQCNGAFDGEIPF